MPDHRAGRARPERSTIVAVLVTVAVLAAAVWALAHGDVSASRCFDRAGYSGPWC